LGILILSFSHGCKNDVDKTLLERRQTPRAIQQ
jgi:hypothetical protein